MGMHIQKVKVQQLLLWIPILGYFLSGIAIVPLQVTAFVLIKPWSLRAYRKISYYFSLIMYWHSTFLVLWWSNTKIEIFMDTNDLPNNIGQEHSILLANHRYETETFMTMSVWNYFRSLGNLRYFAKKDLQYLPMAGWLWKLQEHIFLERNFDKDRTIVEKEVQSLLNHTDAVTIALFPEGTRFTAAKHKASMVVAKEKRLPELKHHLLPRTKGFVTCINTLKKGSNFGLPVVIYDALFVMESQNGEGKSFSILDLLKGHGPNVKLLLRRYPIKSIPESEIECAQWLHKVYQEKDEFMENCLKSGNFIGDNDKKNDERILKCFSFLNVPKPLNVLVFIGGWNVACCLGIMGKIVSVLTNGDSYQLIAFVAILGFGKCAFNVLTGSTKIQTGSSYGQNSDKLLK